MGLEEGFTGLLDITESFFDSLLAPANKTLMP
jgi:hypothetical protein